MLGGHVRRPGSTTRFEAEPGCADAGRWRVAGSVHRGSARSRTVKSAGRAAVAGGATGRARVRGRADGVQRNVRAPGGGEGAEQRCGPAAGVAQRGSAGGLVRGLPGVCGVGRVAVRSSRLARRAEFDGACRRSRYVRRRRGVVKLRAEELMRIRFGFAGCRDRLSLTAGSRGQDRIDDSRGRDRCARRRDGLRRRNRCRRRRSQRDERCGESRRRERSRQNIPAAHNGTDRIFHDGRESGRQRIKFRTEPHVVQLTSRRRSGDRPVQGKPGPRPR